MNQVNRSIVSLGFPLQVEDGWPPVAKEVLPFSKCEDGYRLEAAPLFVKNLSVGDVISIDCAEGESVETWRHVEQSAHTTIWLLRLKHPNGIGEVLAKLRDMGCNSVTQDSLGSYAVDVPDTVSITRVDELLAQLDRDSVGVAFPSMRHSE